MKRVHILTKARLASNAYVRTTRYIPNPRTRIETHAYPNPQRAWRRGLNLLPLMIHERAKKMWRDRANTTQNNMKGK